MLIGTRPRVHVLVLIVFTVPLEWTRFSPRFNDQIVSLIEAFAGVGRVDSERVVFCTDSANETTDDSPAGYNIKHCDFLGDLQGVMAERNSVSQDRDLALCPACKRRRHDVRRRHGAVSVLMVLVYAYSVESEFACILELIQITVVEIVPSFRVVIRVR